MAYYSSQILLSNYGYVRNNYSESLQISYDEKSNLKMSYQIHTTYIFYDLKKKHRIYNTSVSLTISSAYYIFTKEQKQLMLCFNEQQLSRAS